MESVRLLMAVSYGKGPRGKATKLHSQLVRSRGHCENCGSQSELQTAHIIRRTWSHTRTDERNAFCLCAKCHRRYTDFPDEFFGFIERTIGLAEYLRLKDKALAGVRKKFDWDAEVLRLQALLKEAA